MERHPHADRTLIEAARDALAAAADAERAPRMQAYMKSPMPFRGVPAPAVKAIERELFLAHPLPRTADGFDAWRDTILALFREASYREERYVALAIATRPVYRSHAGRRESLTLADALVVEGGWWDIVDTVAANLLGGLHAEHPAWMAERMREWSVDEEMWKRRAAIISQLHRRNDVDLPLLYDCIEPSIEDPRFFIRKAIGWALRQAARTHPGEVVRYVEEHGARLSPLSQREALKRVAQSDDTARIRG